MKAEKAEWEVTTLGEVADEISKRVNNPSESVFKSFVGLEHFDSGELKIRRWGSTADLISGMKEFSKGDTLFARRNAYLRRASMVDFDGLCSGDAIVLREKQGKLIEGFLPILLNTDHFWDYALSNAAGSMSKRVNVKTLLKYRFPLPPLDEQKRIADILWAADEAVEKWTEVYRHYESALGLTRCQILQKLSQTEECISLKDVGRWISGMTPSRSQSDFWNGDFPWVSPKDMKQDFITDSEEKLTNTAMNGRVAVLPSESILIVVRGMILAHTFPVALTCKEVTFNQDMKGIIPSSDFLAEFLFHWFKSNSATILLAAEESTHGTKRLATDVLYGIQIPKPSLAKQKMVVAIFESLRIKLVEIAKHIASTQEMFRNLRNETIGAAHV